MMVTSPEYDAAVIGGGIAGLSAAAHLAQAGKKVVLFEQHDTPGGYYTSFGRDGIIFDITAHWTVAHEQVNRMLAGLGAEPIAFVHHPAIGRYVGPGAGGGILLVHDRQRFVRSILDAYPSASAAAVEKLIALALKVEAEIRSIEPRSPELMGFAEKARMLVEAPLKLRTVLRYSRMPGAKFLESLFPGDVLAGLRAALYMLAPIKDFSAIGMLLYIGFALRGSAYQPEGGAIKAAEAFAAAAARHGVEIRYGARVKSILTETGRVCGVTLASGETIRSRNVVSAADIRQTFERFLDPALTPADFRRKLASTPVSGTFVILSIALDTAPAAWGFDPLDAFFIETSDINAALTPDDPEHSLISLQFPEFRKEASDRRLFGLQIVAPATFEYQNHWATGPGHKRTAEYGLVKADFAQRLITRAERYMPGLREHVVSLDIATPMTMHRYTLNDLGAAVGWSYTSTQRWQQKVAFIEGLYLAGHWVGPSGIYNVAQSGRNAAELILRHDRSRP
jgi:phytoene dehydrogenase-like protein